MRLRVDVSDRSAVVVCRCGWRALSLTRPAVLEAAARHEREQHPDDRHARALLCKVRKLTAPGTVAPWDSSD